MLRASVFAVLALAAHAAAQPSGPVQVDLQPVQGLARIDEQGRLVIQRVNAKTVCEMQTATRRVTEYVTEQKIRTVAVPGNPSQTREETYTVKVPVQKEVPYTICVSKSVPEQSEVVCHRSDTGEWRCDWSESPVRFFTAGNGAAEREAVQGHLREWRQVLICDDGESIEPYFARLFQPGTLVISLPERPWHMGGMMPPPIPASPPVERPAEFAPPAPAPAPVPAPGAPQDPAPPAASLDKGDRFGGASYVSLDEGTELEAKLPAGVPPMFAFAVIEGSELQVRFMTQSTQEQTLMTRAPQKGDTAGLIPLKATRLSRTNQIWTIPSNSVQAIAGDGTPLALRDCAQRLGRETTILVTTSGREVDPFWRQNLRPDATILVTPLPDDAGTAVMPMPAPVYPASPMPPPTPVEGAPIPQPPAAGAPVPQPSPVPPAA